MNLDLARSSIRSRPPSRCRNSPLVCPFIWLGAEGQMTISGASIAATNPLFPSLPVLICCTFLHSTGEISHGEYRQLMGNLFLAIVT